MTVNDNRSATGGLVLAARRKRTLFMGEAVTLAHVARPVVLARGLDPRDYDVHFACDPRYNQLLGNLPMQVWAIETIPSKQFLDALARGAPVYDVETLRRYVTNDLNLLESIKPDAVVGDFRLSLSVSAELVGIPYFAICNAYWSPYARQRFPMPELPLSRLVGRRIAKPFFHLARPLAFYLHTRPLNRVRKDFGLPTLGTDLRRIYTHADVILYADLPELTPIYDLPDNHH